MQQTAKRTTARRQEQIVQGALSLVAAHGVRGLSLGRIGRRVGLAPSAMYRHFASKDAILDAMLALIRKRLLANVQAVREETADPLERLQRLLGRHVRLILENQAIPRIIFSDEVFSGHARRKRQLHALLQAYLKEVAEILRDAQDGGAVRAGIDPAALAVMFLGLVQPAAILWHVSDGAFDVARQAERGWQLFREAIQARAPHRARAAAGAPRGRRR